MPAAAPLVEAEHLSKNHPMGRSVVKALRDVSFTVPAGSFTVIAGPSGSGKSTLLHLLGCLDKPDTGTLRIGGQEMNTLRDAELSAFRARRLGFIFQTFNLIPVLNAFENVEYPLRVNRLPRAEARERAMELLEAVDLAGHAMHRPGELSGGQCQRVAIARALVMQPDLVLADEPTANLDSATGARIIALMHQLQQKSGTAFVIATHDPMVAAQAEEKHTIRDGQLDAV